jgi:hypothetical protein
MSEYTSNSTSGSQRDVYFAGLAKEDIVAELSKKTDMWYENISLSGIYRKMKKSYAAYYGYNSTGAGHTSSEIIKTGEQGELSLVKANHFRNLLQHLLVMTTSSRPAMDARAINTDYRSLAQTILANGILDYYMREKRLEQCLKLATEYSLVFGEGYIRMEWDTSAGEEYAVDPDTNKIQFTGDIAFNVLNPLDVIKDVFRTDTSPDDWIIVRNFKNRFELVAKYPELAEEILKAKTKDELDMTFNYKFKTEGQLRSDLIPVYEFFHKKSDALPNGRQVVFCTEKAIFFDGPLPYEQIPVYRIAPGDFIGTPSGYSVAFDLLGLQETVDGLYSIVVTNQSTFGVQNIMLPQGHNVSFSALPGGLNVIEYDPSTGLKPEALNLTHTPPEIFNFINKIESVMETISGVNPVSRGNPEANLRSGNALALIQSMAIQFNSGLQQSYTQLIESIGTALLKTLRDFAAVPRVAMIAGKNNRSFMREFTGNDLDKISRVVVDSGNPLARTTAGKLEMANNLLQQGLLKNAQEYIMVMKTGNLDVMLEHDLSELANIKAENERLSEGKPVQVVLTDDHVLHIKEHKAVIASPDARENQQVVQSVLQHIQEHIGQLQTADPNLLNILGQPSLAQQQPQPMPGGQQGAPGGSPAGANPQSGPMGQTPAETPPNVKMPNLPKNPMTGQPPAIPGVNQ